MDSTMEAKIDKVFFTNSKGNVRAKDFRIFLGISKYLMVAASGAVVANNIDIAIGMVILSLVFPVFVLMFCLAAVITIRLCERMDLNPEEKKRK